MGRSLTDRTHGRWPWVAAAAAPVATTVAWRERDRLAADGAWVEWLPLAALFWHQTEEWVWPGGFLPWINRGPLGSGEDEFPITRRAGLVINTGMGWALGIAAGTTRDPRVSSLQLALLAGNAGLHIGQAARTRRRNPGLISAVALFVPLVAAGYSALLRRSSDRRGVAAAAGAGLVASAGMLLGMRRRTAAR